MFYSAKVIGSIFSNPPFYILRCYIAGDEENTVKIVKGKIPGPVGRGFVFTFKGKETVDKKNRPVMEVLRSPINPKWLKSQALSSWATWSSEKDQESIELFSILSESGANVSLINSLWVEVSSDPQKILDNPWFLVQKGLSFKIADNIALKLKGKIDYGCPQRIEASILWSLKVGVRKGHCYLTTDTVFRDTTLLTGVSNIKKIAVEIKRLVDKKVIYYQALNFGFKLFI